MVLGLFLTARALGCCYPKVEGHFEAAREGCRHLGCCCSCCGGRHRPPPRMLEEAVAAAVPLNSSPSRPTTTSSLGLSSTTSRAYGNGYDEQRNGGQMDEDDGYGGGEGFEFVRPEKDRNNRVIRRIYRPTSRHALGGGGLATRGSPGVIAGEWEKAVPVDNASRKGGSAAVFIERGSGQTESEWRALYDLRLGVADRLARGAGGGRASGYRRQQHRRSRLRGTGRGGGDSSNGSEAEEDCANTSAWSGWLELTEERQESQSHASSASSAVGAGGGGGGTFTREEAARLATLPPRPETMAHVERLAERDWRERTHGATPVGRSSGIVGESGVVEAVQQLLPSRLSSSSSSSAEQQAIRRRQTYAKAHRVAGEEAPPPPLLISELQPSSWERVQEVVQTAPLVGRVLDGSSSSGGTRHAPQTHGGGIMEGGAGAWDAAGRKELLALAANARNASTQGTEGSNRGGRDQQKWRPVHKICKCGQPSCALCRSREMWCPPEAEHTEVEAAGLEHWEHGNGGGQAGTISELPPPPWLMLQAETRYRAQLETAQQADSKALAERVGAEEARRHVEREQKALQRYNAAHATELRMPSTGATGVAGRLLGLTGSNNGNGDHHRNGGVGKGGVGLVPRIIVPPATPRAPGMKLQPNAVLLGPDGRPTASGGAGGSGASPSFLNRLSPMRALRRRRHHSQDSDSDVDDTGSGSDGFESS